MGPRPRVARKLAQMLGLRTMHANLEPRTLQICLQTKVFCIKRMSCYLVVHFFQKLR